MNFHKAKPGDRFIEISHVDPEQDCLLCEPEMIPFDECNAQLLTFKGLQQEYGKCKGKIYRDRKDRETRTAGYVFQKREKYNDCNETYLHETWVSFNEVIEPAKLATVKGITPAEAMQELKEEANP